MYQSLARAYAVTVQCAAACAPSKNSPGTYATCCKQHAVAAAKPKPAATKPVSNVIKSTRPKPLTTGQLHQSQIKNVDDNTDTQLVPPVFKQLSDIGKDPSPPPNTQAPSGGGSCGTAGVECHNHGPRLEGAHPQSDASYEYGGTFQIPQANDQLTLEFQDLAHSQGNDRSGYKVVFNEGKSGVFMWKQSTDGYGDPIPPNLASRQLRMQDKENRFSWMFT